MSMKNFLLSCYCILSFFVFQNALAEETLQDVTGGNTISGITTLGAATGTAKMSWKD
jgi:hypothetical protein